MRLRPVRLTARGSHGSRPAGASQARRPPRVHRGPQRRRHAHRRADVCQGRAQQDRRGRPREPRHRPGEQTSVHRQAASARVGLHTCTAGAPPPWLRLQLHLWALWLKGRTQRGLRPSLPGRGRRRLRAPAAVTHARCRCRSSASPRQTAARWTCCTRPRAARATRSSCWWRARCARCYAHCTRASHGAWWYFLMAPTTGLLRVFGHHPNPLLS